MSVARGNRNFGNSEFLGSSVKQNWNGKGNPLDLRDFGIELPVLTLCVRECLVGPTNVGVPMVPCGLCDRWFHIQCLGLPESAPRYIRGLYFCQDCLGALRDLRWMARRFQEREARMEALEAQVAFLGVEQAQLKERQSRSEASVEFGDRVVRVGVSLVRENVELKHKIVDTLKSASEEANAAADLSDGQRNSSFTAIAEMQRLMENHLLDQATNQRPYIEKAVGFPPAPVFRKRKFMSTVSPGLKHQNDDNYLYCDNCKEEHLGNCPKYGPMNRVHDSIVADSDPVKADHSLPPGLLLRTSSIPGAGLGVWANNDFAKGEVFGPYVGQLRMVDAPELLDSEFCWQIIQNKNLVKPEPKQRLHEQKQRLQVVDGKDMSQSNWMRYVNCANLEELRNLTAFQYKSHVFYRTIKPIAKGTELLVWYGTEYASDSEARFPAGDHRLVGSCMEIYDRFNQEFNNQFARNTPQRNSSSNFNTPGSSSNSLALKRKETSLIEQLQQPMVLSESLKGVSTSSATSGGKVRIVQKSAAISGQTPNAGPPNPSPSSADGKFRCHVCNTSFTRDYNLKQHQQRVHGIVGGGHWCQPCGLQFKTPFNLQEHEMRRHGAKSTELCAPMVKCNLCSLMFVSHAQMLVHMNTVHAGNGTRPPKADARKQLLQCPYCKAQYLEKDNLAKHVANKHPGAINSQIESVRYFSCPTCNKRFDQASSQRRHTSQCSRRSKIVASTSQSTESSLLEGEAGNWNTLSEAEKAQLVELGYVQEVVGAADQEWNREAEDEGYYQPEMGDFVVQAECDPEDKAIIQLPEGQGEPDSEPWAPLFFVDTEIDTSGAVTLD